MKDNLQLKGDIFLEFRDGDGRVLKTLSFENLVVDGGRSNAVRLMGGDTAGYVVTQIGFGSGTTAATVSDNALTTPFVKALNTGGTTNIYTFNSVKFGFKLDNGEANGLNIAEMGLFNSNNDLVSRKVLDTPFLKDVSFYITGYWVLRVI